MGFNHWQERYIYLAFSAMAASTAIGVVRVPISEDEVMLKLDALNPLLSGIQVKDICEGDADPAEFRPVMVDLYMERKFSFDKLSDFYAFNEINQTVSDQYSGKRVKAILKILIARVFGLSPVLIRRHLLFFLISHQYCLPEKS
jgi:Zn-dependent alcohol dehydrogenase